MFERIDCDTDFAKDLADLGGYNYFGEPVFRLVWAQNIMRVKPSPEGPWYVEEWAEFRDPIWCLQKWLPPDAFGTPELYNFLMGDSFFSRSSAGPYPEMGDYITVAKFKSVFKHASENRLIIETLPLNWDALTGLAEILTQAASMTQWEVECARQAEKEFKEREKQRQAEDALFDALPEFYGPVSYRGQITRTSLIDREMAKVEDVLKRLNVKRLPRGFFQKSN